MCRALKIKIKTQKMINYIFLLLFYLFPLVICSEGDRSPLYQHCVKECTKGNCNLNVEQTLSETQPPKAPWLWGCRDNCRYNCMFMTVEKFEERGFDIPKFHGKWPIKRLFGIQEPASVLGSLLNLLAHAYMYRKMKKTISIRTMPIALFWHVFAWICMNAWVWSMVFHTRDVFFTEFMDYACALSMVMSLFIAAVIRVFHRARKLVACAVLVSLVYFGEHVRYLHAGRIDYDYNMHVNLFFGVAGSGIWLVWAGAQLAAGRRHARPLLAFVLLSGAALALELLDFPPKFYAWDAHALWHLSTAPLPLLFYRFIIDDLVYLRGPAAPGKNNIKLP